MPSWLINQSRCLGSVLLQTACTQIAKSFLPIIQLEEMLWLHMLSPVQSQSCGSHMKLCHPNITVKCLEYVQGDHLQLLLEGLLGSSRLPSHGALMGISAGLFLPTTWLPDLGALSYVGALGVVSALGLTGKGCKACSIIPSRLPRCSPNVYSTTMAAIESVWLEPVLCKGRSTQSLLYGLCFSAAALRYQADTCNHYIMNPILLLPELPEQPESTGHNVALWLFASEHNVAKLLHSSIIKTDVSAEFLAKIRPVP